MPEFTHAVSSAEYAAAAKLFNEYALWLNIDLSFQKFDKELNELKEMYASPVGGIILLKEHNDFIGCVGIRKLDESTAEIKRMYLQPHAQGRGFGMALLNAALELARCLGYKSVRLDTLNTMTPAMNLYRKAGFIETPAYYHNPNETAVYFLKEL